MRIDNFVYQELIKEFIGMVWDNELTLSQKQEYKRGDERVWLCEEPGLDGKNFFDRMFAGGDDFVARNHFTRKPKEHPYEPQLPIKWNFLLDILEYMDVKPPANVDKLTLQFARKRVHILYKEYKSIIFERLKGNNQAGSFISEKDNLINQNEQFGVIENSTQISDGYYSISDDSSTTKDEFEEDKADVESTLGRIIEVVNNSASSGLLYLKLTNEKLIHSSSEQTVEQLIQSWKNTQSLDNIYLFDTEVRSNMTKMGHKFRTAFCNACYDEKSLNLQSLLLNKLQELTIDDISQGIKLISLSVKQLGEIFSQNPQDRMKLGGLNLLKFLTQNLNDVIANELLHSNLSGVDDLFSLQRVLTVKRLKRFKFVKYGKERWSMVSVQDFL